MHRAQRADRGRLARGRHRLHGQPLLRLGPRGGQLSPRKIGAGFIDARHRRRRRVDVARADGLRRRDDRRAQREAAQAAVHGAAGHLGRPDRDARGLHAATTSTSSRSTSQQKAARAIEEQALRQARCSRSRTTTARSRSTSDEHPRADTTLEALAGLKPAFVQMGAAPMGPNGETLDQLALKRYPDTQADRARPHRRQLVRASSTAPRAVLMGSEEWGKKRGLKPRARIRAMATAGAEPVIMLTAPAPASARALKKESWTRRDARSPLSVRT